MFSAKTRFSVCPTDWVLRIAAIFVASATIQAETKIEQQELAATGNGIKYAVSPRGLHVATSMLKGSRSIILMDGAAGPLFDELVWVKGRKLKTHNAMLQEQVEDMNMDPSSAPVVFNDDGSRFAYVGRQGDEFVVMLDGKEFSRGPFSSEAIQSLGFTPGGKRLCYLQTPSTLSNGLEVTHLFVEGHSEPPAAYASAESVIFSRDGEHYAYTFGNPQGDIFLVVDGKLDPPQYHAPGWVMTRNALFTGDSKHLITIRDKVRTKPDVTRSKTEQRFSVFIDQQPAVSPPGGEVAGVTKGERIPVWADFENVYVAPAGENFISQYKMPDHNTHRLFFNRTQIADSMGVNSITWSPDGKRYMAHCLTSSQSQFMVIDGKKQHDYRDIRTLAPFVLGTVSLRGFTADSSKCVYIGLTDKAFVVVEGEESEGLTNVDSQDLRLSEKGAHIAYVGTKEGQKVLIVDGNPLAPRKDFHDFMFNEEGVHYECLSGDKQRGSKVIIDGVEQKVEYGGDLIHYHASSRENDRQCIFSPDGKHVVYLASVGNVDTGGYSVDHSPTKAVCLDGKIIPCEGENSQVNAFFTPDSKHVIWIDWGGKSTSIGGSASSYPSGEMSGYSVYIDGKLAGHFDCPQGKYMFDGMTLSAGGYFAVQKNATAMERDDTFVFVAPVGNVIKRIRLTPSNDINLTTFATVADAQQQALQAKANEEPTPTPPPSNW